MKLSHATKVAVRKALTALHRADEFANADDPMTDAMGAEEFIAQAYNDSVRRICRKAGFSSRDDLETFAVKHRLLKAYSEERNDPMTGDPNYPGYPLA